MTMRAALLCALLLGLVGCTVSARDLSEDQGPTNTCSSNADCGRGNCAEGVCQTLNGHLESLLLEVTPTTGSSLPAIPFVQALDDVPISGGERTISLARAASVTGHLTPSDKPGCVRTFFGPEGNQLSPSTDGQSIPISVTLTPRDSLLGLPTQVYLADATLPSLEALRDRGAVEYTFKLEVPTATYDVYVVPGHHEVESTDAKTLAAACRIPPQLFRAQAIANDTLLDYRAAATGTLSLEVSFPESAGNLDGWVVDIIDPLSGNPISSEFTLSGATLVSMPGVMGKWWSYQAVLAHSVVTELGQAEAVEGANDFVRLRPPPEVVAPTIFLDRGGLGLFNPANTAKVGDFTGFPSAVMLQGQMVSQDGGTPVSGRVDLVSIEIPGVDDGIFASFQTSVTVDEAGLFDVTLPPGKYKVYGVPPLLADAQLAAHQVEWDVPAGVPFQAGRLLELPLRTEVKGRTSLQSAEIQATASPQTILPFQQAFADDVTFVPTFIPRATAGLVDAAGRFVVRADPGLFDITVRPPETSGFAWAVRSRVAVEAGQQEQDLERLDLPQPSLMQGTVQVGMGETAPLVPFALIRAYAYLDEGLAYTGDPKAARSVIQVAQTRSDENGLFRLLIPESIDTN